MDTLLVITVSVIGALIVVGAGIYVVHRVSRVRVHPRPRPDREGPAWTRSTYARDVSDARVAPTASVADNCREPMDYDPPVPAQRPASEPVGIQYAPYSSPGYVDHADADSDSGKVGSSFDAGSKSFDPGPSSSDSGGYSGGGSPSSSDSGSSGGGSSDSGSSGSY